MISCLLLTFWLLVYGSFFILCFYNLLNQFMIEWSKHRLNINFSVLYIISLVDYISIDLCLYFIGWIFGWLLLKVRAIEKFLQWVSERMQNVKVNIPILNIFMYLCISCVCIALIKNLRLHYLRHLEHIFVISHDVRNLLDLPEISPKSKIRHPITTSDIFPISDI